MSRDLNDSLKQQLQAGVRELNLELPAAALARMLLFLDELQKWNAAYNLTAIRDPAEMVTKHLLDSLSLLPILKVLHESRSAPLQSRLLDVGAGAGLPGIPLALAHPDLQVSVLDSNGKKARFMRHAVRALKLGNVQVIEGRVEDHAGNYDCITSRAFAALADFFDKTSHLLVTGGVWVAMKGKLDGQELAGVPANIQIRETPRLRVPGLQEDRHLVIASRIPPPAPHP